MRSQQVRAPVYLRPEDLKLFVESVPHTEIVITYAGKQQNDRPATGFRNSTRTHDSGIKRFEFCDRIFSSGTDYVSSVGEHLASGLQRIGDVTHVYAGVAAQEVLQSLARGVEHRFAVRGQND